mgnify:CR=1 FL=1
MGIVWRVVSFISVWLLYGLIASLFVKNVNRRDDRLLFSCRGATCLSAMQILKSVFLFSFLKSYKRLYLKFLYIC